ncbi:MAG: preprotein translocase subunit SecY [Pirellulales bacterium]
MWEKLRVVFTIPELRQKIFLTLGLLAVYRIGFWIPLPIFNTAKLEAVLGSSSNEGLQKVLTQVAMFSGSNISQATIFGLGIMPYISASIIFQLLASVWKPLEELQKEGESGRKKINEYTRYATVVLCLFQSWFYVRFLVGNPEQGRDATYVYDYMLVDGALPFSWYLIAVLTMTCGTIFLMWLGEQIDEYGIGNGISLLIMANILARMPDALRKLLGPLFGGEITLGGPMGVEKLLLLVGLFVAVVYGVVFIYKGQRRIKMQSAKHVRGRRVYGGTSQYLPLKVNQAGVMPIIFASSLLLFPALFFGWLGGVFESPTLQRIGNSLSQSDAFTHNFLFIVLIYFFCYFWTAVTFNPKDMAENLKSWGTFIPGYRPGRRTADYLEKVMMRITYVGAAFLAVVAVAPTIVASFAQIDPTLASFYGGTSLLIAVSVAVDLVQKIDSHLVMRNYKGLTE